MNKFRNFKMNERIKQIAEECGLYIAYDNRAVTNKELEYFAELIVQECIRIDIEHWDSPPGDAIREHFGVE
jgi:hypothetical protein